MSWEQMFWFVFNQTTNPMCLIDDERRVVEVNEPMLELIGRSRGEVMGRPSIEFLAPADRPQAERRWQAILQTAGEDYTASGTLLRPDESEVEVDFAARMIRVSDRRLAVYVMLVKQAKGVPARRRRGAKGALTARERQVVTEIALGKETPEIGQYLQISPETVRTHVRNAMSRLNAKTRAHLVAKVMSQNGHLHVTHLEE
jgi:PAS domain S-box-containing protein